METGQSAVVPSRKLFGRNVARIRAETSLTQEKLCELAGIDRSYLQRIESGASNPTIEVAVRLKKALQCPWDDLFHGLS
ncbi:MAG: hypothetical protein QOD99_2350 [Chthoniobacter sp.]|jgi:transcriptional regulator with XRE-family HTH domain|nr:hypothetical protein [Chthoniobacter sp.]